MGQHHDGVPPSTVRAESASVERDDARQSAAEQQELVLSDCQGRLQRPEEVIAQWGGGPPARLVMVGDSLVLPPELAGVDIEELVLLCPGLELAFSASKPAKYDGRRRVFNQRALMFGRVECPASPALSSRAKLICVPESNVGRLMANAALLSGSTLAHHLEVDDTGQFSACELPRGSWRLYAASGSYLGTARANLDWDSDSPILITLKPAMGVALQLVDPEGGPPRLSEAVWDLGTWSEATLPPGFRENGWREDPWLLIAAVLAGMEPSISVPRPGALRHLLSGEAWMPGECLASLTLNAPGYHPRTARVMLRPIDRLKGYESVVLTRPAGESGLRITIASRPACTCDVPAQVPMFRLRMHPMGAEGLSAFELVLSATDDSLNEFFSLPPGKYSILGRDLLRDVAGQAAEVIELVDGQIATLTFDASRTGCINFDPRLSDESNYNGRLNIQLLEPKTPRGTPFRLVTLEARPYELPFQAEGRHEIRLSSPGNELAAKVVVMVRAGEVVESTPVLLPRQ
jgi:hypothetical protein